jgi:lycopene elongase/hydratase (flavuxanthin-forming)
VPIEHWEEAAFYSFLEEACNDRELPVGVVPLSRKYEMAEAATTVSNATKSPPQAPYFVFLIQVSRPGLWTTTALFYLMPLGHRNVPHSATFWLGLFFVLFPLGLLLYGANDIVDAEADRYNPRKGTFLFGSRGASGQLAALRWQIAVAEIPFLMLFFFLVGPRILWWSAALLLAVGLYNAPRFGWKSHPPFDVLIQASYLLVFVLSSWLNRVDQLPWPTFLFGALFAMHSHVFGEVMDIGPDRLSGRRTTATLIGSVPSKILIASLLFIESALVFVFFRDVVITGFLTLGAIWFLLDAALLWQNRAYSPATMRIFMWAWNAASLLGMYWNWSKSSLTHLSHVAGL